MQLTAEQFRQILGSLKSDQPNASEKRRTPRVGVRALVDIVPQAGGVSDGRLIRIRLINLSVGGVNFLYREYLNPGQLLELRLPSLAGPLRIRAVVCHCRQAQGDLFTVGAQFARIGADRDPAPPAGPVTRPAASPPPAQ